MQVYRSSKRPRGLDDVSLVLQHACDGHIGLNSHTNQPLERTFIHEGEDAHLDAFIEQTSDRLARFRESPIHGSSLQNSLTSPATPAYLHTSLPRWCSGLSNNYSTLSSESEGRLSVDFPFRHRSTIDNNYNHNINNNVNSNTINNVGNSNSNGLSVRNPYISLSTSGWPLSSIVDTDDNIVSQLNTSNLYQEQQRHLTNFIPPPLSIFDQLTRTQRSLRPIGLNRVIETVPTTTTTRYPVDSLSSYRDTAMLIRSDCSSNFGAYQNPSTLLVSNSGSRVIQTAATNTLRYNNRIYSRPTTTAINDISSSNDRTFAIPLRSIINGPLSSSTTTQEPSAFLSQSAPQSNVFVERSLSRLRATAAPPLPAPSVPNDEASPCNGLTLQELRGITSVVSFEGIGRSDHDALCLKLLNRNPLSKKLFEREIDESDIRRFCAICCTDFIIGDPLRCIQRCGHRFHDQWFENHCTCPICRCDLKCQLPSLLDLATETTEQIEESSSLTRTYLPTDLPTLQAVVLATLELNAEDLEMIDSEDLAALLDGTALTQPGIPTSLRRENDTIIELMSDSRYNHPIEDEAVDNERSFESAPAQVLHEEKSARKTTTRSGFLSRWFKRSRQEVSPSAPRRNLFQRLVHRSVPTSKQIKN